MSVAVAGRSPTTFEIKSASLALLTLRLKSPDLARLGEELHAQYGDMPDFFEDDGVVLDLSTLPAEQTGSEIDFQQLGELLQARRLRLLAVRGRGPAPHDGAARDCFVCAPPCPPPTAPPPRRSHRRPARW